MNDHQRVSSQKKMLYSVTIYSPSCPPNQICMTFFIFFNVSWVQSYFVIA